MSNKGDKIISFTARKAIIRLDLLHTVLYNHEVQTFMKLLEKIKNTKPKTL